MAPPHQKSNGRRSMFTNKTPHFFKIILQKTLRDGKLEIPKMFIRKYGNGMSSPALLKVPSGDVWKVELRKRDGKVWLKNGWPEFSNHYSLDQGYFLVFRYQGNCNFHVIIMDKTATEIDYPYTNNYHDQQLKGIPDESEDDDDITEIIEEIPPRTQRLKAGEKRLALERAAAAFKSENPFFMLIMQPSYVGLTPRCRLLQVRKAWRLTEEFPVPMKEGEILDDFWVAEKIQEDRPKSASRP
ncbi:hypothetical protein COLO4_11082 [Corchorus olitorius]|uniref:TF-B3 domain-containing protein n=1 Tax=Corchorus olitorius TaxID=93759 RepID=A0A1R3K5T2_9ROSI|nr:hypothetical protein COLO4_11082 [Corchorus olitorius]